MSSFLVSRLQTANPLKVEPTFVPVNFVIVQVTQNTEEVLLKLRVLKLNVSCSLKMCNAS